MSGGAVVIIITRPRTVQTPANKLGGSTTSEIQVLAPVGATDAEVLKAALKQIESE